MPGHGYRYGQRPPDYEPPEPLPLVPDPPQINGRLATPHEVVVLARAYETARQRDMQLLGITERNQT
jgi:hypothetical protein